MYLYECMCVLRHSFKPEEIDRFFERLGTSVGGTGGWGSVIKYRVVGVLQFAYPIRKKRRGLYVLFYFSARGDIIRDVKKKLIYDDEVLRYLLLRVENVPEDVPDVIGLEAQK